MKRWTLRGVALGGLLSPAAALIATSAAALPVTPPKSAGKADSLIVQTQGVYFGFSYGQPHRPYYGRRYYDRRTYGYGRPYYGGPPATTYYTAPYVVERPRSYGDPDALARCASRFKSFNANTGTYITYGGEERLCPYLR